MRKRILLVTLLVSVLGLVLLTLLFSGMSYSRSAQIASGQLSVLMDMYAADHISAPLSDETAQARMEALVKELAEQAGVTESLKAADQMKWVGLMNSCKAQAEEMILTELIYN